MRGVRGGDFLSFVKRILRLASEFCLRKKAGHELVDLGYCGVIRGRILLLSGHGAGSVGPEVLYLVCGFSGGRSGEHGLVDQGDADPVAGHGVCGLDGHRRGGHGTRGHFCVQGSGYVLAAVFHRAADPFDRGVEGGVALIARILKDPYKGWISYREAWTSTATSNCRSIPKYWLAS